MARKRNIAKVESTPGVALPANSSKGRAGQRKAAKAQRTPLWTKCKKVGREEGEKLLWVLRVYPGRIIRGKPASFSIDDCSEKPVPFNGVRSYPSQSMMRQMKIGDKALVLHTMENNSCVAGIVTIANEITPDSTDKSSPFYDSRQPNCNGRKVGIDQLDFISIHITLDRKFSHPVLLQHLRAAEQEGLLSGMQILKQSQMDVSTITPDAWGTVLAMADKHTLSPGANNQAPLLAQSVQAEDVHMECVSPTTVHSPNGFAAENTEACV
ncbi:hypothetical protein ACHAQA_009842 [Verticillium albo-atrum]